MEFWNYLRMQYTVYKHAYMQYTHAAWFPEAIFFDMHNLMR